MSDHPITRTEADSVIEQTLLGVEPVELELNSVYAVRTPDGFKLIDLQNEEILKRAGWDRNLEQSHYTFQKVDSFVRYCSDLFAGGYEKAGALCIAHEGMRRVRMIFDSKPSKWAKVIADLQLVESEEAHRWRAASGQYMKQLDFAEFCEQNLQTFITPPSANVLEIAETLQAKKTVDFQNATRLTNGAIKLKRDEQIVAVAGETGEILVPDKVTIATPLFKFGPTYERQARLRYRIKDDAVVLSFLLVEPEQAIEHAFGAVVTQIEEALEMPLFFGSLS